MLPHVLYPQSHAIFFFTVENFDGVKLIDFLTYFRSVWFGLVLVSFHFGFVSQSTVSLLYFPKVFKEDLK